MPYLPQINRSSRSTTRDRGSGKMVRLPMAKAVTQAAASAPSDLAKTNVRDLAQRRSPSHTDITPPASTQQCNRLDDKLVAAPSFDYAQKVNFVGGSGVIRSYQREAGTWNYLVEMELGPEPDFGRIGAEATVIISEADLDAA
jgi:hypothetical protein